jgi:hypothetical protein
MSCDTPDPDDLCPSTGKKHKPDWDTLNVTHDGEVYIDINCKDCGRSGCVGSQKTLEEGISW